MKLWIPGSRGYLGRHVAQEALRRGHELFRLDVDLTEDNYGQLLPEIDAAIHCAGIARWSPKHRSDARFQQNVDLAFAVINAALRLAGADRFIWPLPHGALAPWNAYSQSMAAAYEEIKRAAVTPVYLPTLYGLGDPHHAKAIPSFLMAATGRGEQAIVLYPPDDVWRHYLSVEAAASLLVDTAEDRHPGSAADETVLGERWNVRALAQTVVEIAAKYGRQIAIEESGWLWKPDGLGSPVPTSIGPETGLPSSVRYLEDWLDKVIGAALKPYAAPAETPPAPPPVDPAFEKLLAENAPSRVASADAPPPPPASPAAPLHDDLLPNPRV